MAARTAKQATLSLKFDNPKRRIFFNTFEMDLNSAAGFVITHFALVISRECLDLLTIVLPQETVDASKESLIRYVRDIERRTDSQSLNLVPIPNFTSGTVDVADVINCGRALNNAEMAFHSFSLRGAIESQNTDNTPPPETQFVALARCSTPLQVKWIIGLYEH